MYAVCSRMDSFTKELLEFRRGIPEATRPTWLRTTTITLTAKLPGVKFDHEKIHTVFKKFRHGIPVYYGHNKNPFMWRVFYSDFYNQLSIGYTDALSTKKVKLFPNGSLQIAGCSDIADCKRFTTQLCWLLNAFFRVEVPRDVFRIVMYNGYFSLNHFVDVYSLIDILDGQGVKYTYDPDRYAAVKVKLNNATVSIFVSGSVLITGTKSQAESLEVYKRIISLTQRVLMEPNDMSEKFNVHLGYTIDQWEKV
jgi:hypothetical protein